MATETRHTESSVAPATLFMAIELGSTTWKLALTVGVGRRPAGARTPERGRGIGLLDKAEGVC